MDIWQILKYRQYPNDSLHQLEYLRDPVFFFPTYSAMYPGYFLCQVQAFADSEYL